MTEEDKYMALLDANEKIMFEEWQNNIIRENIGIVSAAPNDKAPIFLYYSYAEYFAACYLCNKLTSSSAVNEMVLNTIFDIVQNDVVVFSYCVKHLLHENIKSDTSLQIIIYDFIFNNKMNGYAFIKWLMNEEKVDDKLPKQDAAGRTYLHYAVLSQKVKNVVYVLLHTFHLISNNNVNESLFILSEYINVPDKTGQTALMYGKNQVKALLKDIKNAGQQECAPPEYDRNVVVFLNNLSRRNRTSDLCIIFKNQGKYSENVFQKLFSNISFSSLLCILHNSDPILLYILLNDDEKGLNVFDHLCFEENFVHEERLEIFKFWWKNEDIKDHATDKMIMAAIENDCLDYFKFFLKKTGCTLDVRKCFFVACSANVLTFVDFILNSDFDEIMKYFSHSLPDLKYVANMKIAERIILKTKPDLYALIRERPFKKSVMERMGSDFVLKIIEYFLDIDADLTFFNKFSEGIWKYVLEKGDDTLIKRLLHKNALKISQLQEIHESSFPYKQRVIQNLQSCIENVKSYYSEEKYNINTDDNGESRLLKALYDENEILFAFLLRKGADVNCVNENGKTLLNLACDRYKDDFVNLALGYGASFDIHDAEGKIDFWDPSKSNLNQLAFTFQHLNENDFWKKLRDNEYFRSDDFVNNERDFFNFSVTNTAKETLWHLGADGDTLPKLINIKREETRVQNEYKDTINNQNSNGHTPLHLAAKRNKKNNVKLLLEEGAYYNVTNNSKTPEDLSEKGGETQIFLHKIDLLFHHAEYSNAEKWIDFKIQKFKNLVNDDNDNYSESISDDDLSWIFKNLQILKNHQAETLLHKASQNPDHTVINFVLDLMFDEDLEEQKNVLSRIEYQNLLLSLIESNRLQAAKILVEEGILFNNAEFKISKINKKCECAIEFDKIREVFDHIYKEDFNFVQRKIELNELKIDIKNVRDYKGKTISDYAKHTTNYSFMVFLLNQGVKVTDLKAVTNKKMKQTILLHLFPKKQKISTTTPQRRQFVIISFAAIILFVFIIISKK